MTSPSKALVMDAAPAAPDADAPAQDGPQDATASALSSSATDPGLFPHPDVKSAAAGDSDMEGTD